MWADFGHVGNTEKKIGPIMRFFHVFMGKKNIVASALKSSTK